MNRLVPVLAGTVGTSGSDDICWKLAFAKVENILHARPKAGSEIDQDFSYIADMAETRDALQLVNGALKLKCAAVVQDLGPGRIGQDKTYGMNHL